MEKNRVVKASIWYVISSFFLKGIGFLTTPIFARILTREEFGSYSNFGAWLSIISIVATLSLNSSLIRGRFDYKENLDELISSNLILGTLASLIFSILLISNISFVSSIFVLDYKYIYIMCLYVLVTPAYDMFLCVERFKYKYKMVAFITIFVSISSVLLSLILIRFMQDNLMARVIGGYFPYIGVAIFLYIRFLIKAKKVEFIYWKYSLCIAIPYIFHLLSGTILGSSDKTMITKFCGADQNALYSMAYSISMIVGTIYTSLNNAFSPWLGEKLISKEYCVIEKYSRVYILFFVVGIIGCILVAPEALMILGGEQYMEAKFAIPPVMCSYYFIFVYSMYGNIEQFEKKTLGMAIATCIAALTNIVLNYVFVPKYGYLAASYTTLAGYMLLFIFHYYLVRKMGLHHVYSFKFILAVALIIMIISMASLLLYSYPLFRYIIIVIYIGIIVGTGTKNWSIIKNIKR